MSSEETVHLFAELRKHVHKEHFAKVVEIADEILKIDGSDADALHAKCSALILEGELDAALETCDSTDILTYEKAYVLYRKGDLEAAGSALAMCADADSERVRCLRAQLDFRIGAFDAAASFYEEASGWDDEDIARDATVNRLAADASGGEPNLHSQELQDLYGAEASESFEVAYNLGIALVAAGDVGAGLSQFLEARRLCVQTLEDDGEPQEAIDEETAVLDIAAAHAYLLQRDYARARELCLGASKSARRAADQCVAANNLCVSRGQHDLFDSFRRMKHAVVSGAHRLRPEDLLSLRSNQCLLLLFMNRRKDFAEAVAALEADYPHSEAALLLRAADSKVHNGGAAAAAETLLSAGPALRSRPRVRLAVAQCLADCKDVSGAAEELKKLSESALEAAPKEDRMLITSPALLATLSDMLSSSGDAEGSLAVLEGSITREHLEAMAHFPVDARVSMVKAACGKLVAAGNARRAVSLADECLAMAEGEAGAFEGEGVVLQLLCEKAAALGLLLGEENEDDAEEELHDAIDKLRESVDLPDCDGGDVDALELERSFAPQRLARRRSAQKAQKAPETAAAAAAAAKEESGAGDKDDDEEEEEEEESGAAPEDGAGGDFASAEREERRRQRVLAKRAKRRDAYLQKLQSLGKFDPKRPSKPDPERWLPVKQRSYARRGRKRNKFVGAQGSGDGAMKDAAKLDVAKRVAEREERRARGETEEEETKRSSANVKVATQARRGKKKGKRR